MIHSGSIHIPRQRHVRLAVAITMSQSKHTKNKTQRRNAGRPIEGQSVGREAVINAAISLLRETSTEQLTLSEVAAAAKVDRALIRYYFSNKTGLLKAVAIQLLGELQSRSLELFTEKGSLEEKIRSRLTLLINIMHEMPQFAQLVFKEIYYAEQAQKTGAESNTQIAQGAVDRGLALTKAMIDSPEVDTIGRTLDPRFLHLMMLGTSVFFATSQPLIQLMFGGEAQKQDITQHYIDFATKIIMRGLGAPLPAHKEKRRHQQSNSNNAPA